MSPIPPYTPAPSGGYVPYPPGGDPLQFLGLDPMGDPAWLTAPYADYLYNSSGAQQGNRFNDWGDLMDALALIEGPKTVTFEQDELIPAGAYDLSNLTLRGNFLPLGAGGLFISLDEGVTFTDVTQFRLDGGIGLINTSSTPNYSPGPGQFVIVAVSGNSGVGSSGAPMFEIGPGAALVLALQDGGQVSNLGGAGNAVIDVDPAANLAAVAMGGVASELQDNTISGDGVFVRLIQGVAVNSAVGLTQSAFLGMVVDQLFTDSRNLGYDPSGTGGTLTAGNVQAAIDELAGLV